MAVSEVRRKEKNAVNLVKKSSPFHKGDRDSEDGGSLFLIQLQKPNETTAVRQNEKCSSRIASSIPWEKAGLLLRLLFTGGN